MIAPDQPLPCDHSRACYGLAASGIGWTFACPDCVPTLAYVGYGASPKEAYEDFVYHVGMPVRSSGFGFVVKPEAKPDDLKP